MVNGNLMNEDECERLAVLMESGGLPNVAIACRESLEPWGYEVDTNGIVNLGTAAYDEIVPALQAVPGAIKGTISRNEFN